MNDSSVPMVAPRPAPASWGAEAPLRRAPVSIPTLLPLVILAYSFLVVTIEMKVNLAGLNIYSYRIALLLLMPVVIGRLIRNFSELGWPDVLILAGSCWTMVAFIANYPVGDAVVRSSALVLDAAGSYLVARTSIRSVNDLRVFLLLILPGLVLSAAALTLESVSGRLIVRPFFGSIFGRAINYEGGVAQGTLELLNETRLGLLRAYGFFSFPILGGAVLSSLLPLYLMSGIRSWPLWLGAAACMAAFFSLSSAAFIALGIGVGLVVFDRLLPYMRPLKWSLIVFVGAGVGLIVNILVPSGLAGLIGRFTLNPATAYARRMQWLHGSESVAEHPLFGIGFREYERADWMTASIDAHFLALAMRDGLITPIGILLGAVVVMAKLGSGLKHLSRADRDLVIAVNFTIATLLFVAMTVTYFSEANIWFMAVLGVGAAVSSAIRHEQFHRLMWDRRRAYVMRQQPVSAA